MIGCWHCCRLAAIHYVGFELCRCSGPARQTAVQRDGGDRGICQTATNGEGPFEGAFAIGGGL
ncbi:MAG: hypothetical protein AAF995_03695, partial [Planctomycetota bacterium]